MIYIRVMIQKIGARVVSQENGTWRVKALLGLPVIDKGSGKEIGAVKRVVFDHRQGRLAGLVSGGKWFSRDRYLSFERIREIGQHAVVLDNAPEDGPGWEFLSEANPAPPVGWQVRTGSGKALGTIEDVLFNAQTGRLEGMEISRGLVQDFVDGRVTIPMPAVYTMGQEAVVIPEEIGEQIWSERKQGEQAEGSQGMQGQEPDGEGSER